MTEFHASNGADGVTIITWDTPGKSMNVMSMAGFAELDGLIQQALADEAVKGVVITSAEADFAGGMDLAVLAQMREADPEARFADIMRMHQVLRRIELAGQDVKTKAGGKPIVAALPGTALGIGLELPLATHRIFAADQPKAKIGLPEIKLGLFPGGGGTTRLSRKLGAMMAAPYLLEGLLLDPKAAQAAGLVDELVAPEALLEVARAWVLAAKPQDLVKPWDQKGWKMPGGAPYHPAGYLTFVGASAMVNGKTQGVYPAAKALLSAVYEGALVGFDTALKIEARHFTRLLQDPSPAAMIRSLFLNKGALEKGANRPAEADQSVKRLGVMGAGMMGAGIAYVAAQAGIEVILIDADAAAAARGKAQSEALVVKAVKRGKLGQEAAEALLARITPTTDYQALAGVDLIIEAVFEDPKVKGEVTKRAEAAAGPEVIFASNTSTLPISALAKASQDQAQFIGIHFFSPVDKMALVEIIRGKETGTRAVAKALDFVRQIRKTPIVVNDARFFYANRCIIPYLNEGVRLVAEGVRPALIENAARLLGMPLGPLQLLDETSISLGVNIAKATKAAMGADYPDGAVDEVLFWLEAEGRLGRKSGAGFYTYSETGTRLGLWQGLEAKFPPAEPQPDLADVQNRLMMAQVLEAVRAFEAGVLQDIREGDVGAILGWGFAPWSGGPFAWLDQIGAAQAVSICDALEAAHGARFAAPGLLRDLAQNGQGFYALYGEGQPAR